MTAAWPNLLFVLFFVDCSIFVCVILKVFLLFWPLERIMRILANMQPLFGDQRIGLNLIHQKRNPTWLPIPPLPMFDPNGLYLFGLPLNHKLITWSYLGRTLLQLSTCRTLFKILSLRMFMVSLGSPCCYSLFAWWSCLRLEVPLRSSDTFSG